MLMYSRLVINNTLGSVEGVPKMPHGFWNIFGDIFGSVASAGASAYASERNYQAQKETNEMNYRIAKEANANNVQLMNMQNNAQMDMWNKQNAYNTPAHQAALLSQGGFNPALAYENGSAAAGSMTAATPAPSNVAQMQAPQFSDINLAGIIQSIASAAESSSKAEGNRLGNTYIQQEKEAELANKRATLENILQNSKLTDQQRKNLIGELNKVSLETSILRDSKDSIVRGRSLDNILKGVQAEQLRAATEEIRQSTLLKKAQEAFQIDENSRQWSLLVKKIQEMDANISLMASQGTLNVNTAAKVFMETVGTVLDNKQKAEFLPFVKDAYKADIAKKRYNPLKTLFGMELPMYIDYDDQEKDLRNAYPSLR